MNTNAQGEFEILRNRKFFRFGLMHGIVSEDSHLDLLEKLADEIDRDVPVIVSVTHDIATKSPSTIEVV